MTPTPETLADLRKKAEAWRSSDEWLRTNRDPWINGRAHPDVILALLDRIADLEVRADELESLGKDVRPLVEDVATHGRQADAPFTTQERAQKMLAVIDHPGGES